MGSVVAGFCSLSSMSTYANVTAIAFVLALHLDRADHCHMAIGPFIFNPYHFSDHEFLMDLLVDWYGRTTQEDYQGDPEVDAGASARHLCCP